MLGTSTTISYNESMAAASGICNLIGGHFLYLLVGFDDFVDPSYPVIFIGQFFNRRNLIDTSPKPA